MNSDPTEAFARYPRPAQPHRHNIWPVYLSYIVIEVVVVAYLAIVRSHVIIWFLIPVAVLSTLPTLWLTFWVVDKILPVLVETTGVKSYNSFGIKATVKWPDIRKVKRLIFFPGVEWLCLLDHRNFLICTLIPIFVTDRKRLYEEVKLAAGSDHPLTRMLATRVGK